MGAVVGAAREALERGGGQALVTLGGHGAILVGPGHTWWARGPRVRTRGTVGAGDRALAGFPTSDGSPAERPRHAVAGGTAAVSLPGTTIPFPDDVAPGAITPVADPRPAAVGRRALTRAGDPGPLDDP